MDAYHGNSGSLPKSNIQTPNTLEIPNLGQIVPNIHMDQSWLGMAEPILEWVEQTRTKSCFVGLNQTQTSSTRLLWKLV